MGYLAAMLKQKLQDVQILILNGDGDGVSSQHVYAVDVELAVSILLQQFLHHVVVTWKNIYMYHNKEISTIYSK